MFRRSVLLALALVAFHFQPMTLATATAGPAITATDAPPSLTLVTLIDTSESFTVPPDFKKWWTGLVKGLRGGDRIVVAAINERTYTSFTTVSDIVLPTPTSADNPLTYKKRLDNAFREVEAAVDQLLAAPKVKLTSIMGGVLAAQKVFESDTRQRVLLLCSDMLEDAEGYDFERERLTPKRISAILEARKRDDLIPNLNGARVIAFGASGKTTKHAKSVENFWTAFMKQAGAAEGVTFNTPISDLR